MESSLVLPVVIFLLFFAVMFYLYYRAQKQIKMIEEDYNNVNKDIDGVVQCALLRCSCRLCLNSNRAGNTTTTATTDAHHVGASAPDSHVWSVSRQINQVYGPPPPHAPPPNYRWPTHDHHISLDSFTLNTGGGGGMSPTGPAGGKTAPPPYTEVELPSYDEAIAVEHNYANDNHYETIPATQTTRTAAH